MVKLGPFNFVVGSGTIVRETREVRDFDEINLGGSGEVHMTQTGEESLAIEADDNILPLLTTEVRGRRLELGTQRGVNFTLHRSVHYYITVKSLRGLIISGSGKLDTAALSTDALAVSISGSGKVEATALAAESLDVSITGSGSIALAGQAARLNLHISGAGSYDAPDLTTGTARIHVSGSGSANLTVADALEVRISGSGSVRYGGQPTITKSISGSGSIRRRD